MPQRDTRPAETVDVMTPWSANRIEIPIHRARKTTAVRRYPFSGLTRTRIDTDVGI